MPPVNTKEKMALHLVSQPSDLSTAGLKDKELFIHNTLHTGSTDRATVEEEEGRWQKRREGKQERQEEQEKSQREREKDRHREQRVRERGRTVSRGGRYSFNTPMQTRAKKIYGSQAVS